MLPLNDTIAAAATPLFRGGIGVVRLSGPEALSIADRIFESRKSPSSLSSHTALHGFIEDNGQKIDEALCLVMRAPNSYTGENVVELSLHGSPLLIQKVLAIIFSLGARPAEPGEFTFRAYMNRRLDLTQAEAVHHLVNSKSESGLRNAFLQLQGSLQKEISSIRDGLLEISANFEADIEFPDENLNTINKPEALKRLNLLSGRIKDLVDSYEIGRKIEEGLNIVLCGPPNSGKSTLLNRLMSEDRAIVHSSPGTTRDAVLGTLEINGASIRLIDTAGIREKTEPVEEEGIRRTFLYINEADLVLWVQDINEPNGSGSKIIEEIAGQENPENDKKVFIRIYNKSDKLEKNKRTSLEKELKSGYEVLISAKLGWGIENIRSIIADSLRSLDISGREGIVLTGARQKQLLETCQESLYRSLQGVRSNLSTEYFCSDINESLSALDEIIGAEPNENIYDILFKNFCLGK